MDHALDVINWEKIFGAEKAYSQVSFISICADEL